MVQSAIDPAFGIVAIDPDQGLYTVRVNEADAPNRAGDGSFAGPWSDPKIAPMNWRRKP